MDKNKQIRTLIIPDIHGREFWKEPVYDVLKNNPDAVIVFLGDYHDPYGYEGINKDKSLENFKEIIELKRTNKDRIHLLVGNHDCSYITTPYICECRHDYSRDDEFRRMYWENHELFELAYRDGRFLYTHAGIIPDWVDDYKQFWEERGEDTPDAFLNKRFQDTFISEDISFWSPMYAVGYVRGGLEVAGSVIWGDMSEHIRRPFENYIQVFGHTQQEELPIHYKDSYLDESGNEITNEFYNLDCRKAFYMDDKNVIRYYDTEEDIPEENTLFNNWKWK